MPSDIPAGLTVIGLLKRAIALTGFSLISVAVLSVAPNRSQFLTVPKAISETLPSFVLKAAATEDTATAYNLSSSIKHVEVRLRKREVIIYQDSLPIKRYPIGVGRRGWETPTGTFRVTQMKRNPIWINPFTNEPIPASDPRNPLHGYWIGFWTDGNNWIGFHGTLDDRTVGQAASHGCIHMHKSDLAELFSIISLGTPVTVLD